MKTVYIVFLMLIVTQSVVFGQKDREKNKVKPDTVSVDSLEYDLIIIDPGFESWLATKPSKDFYSKEYYALKNRLYVMEWNHRYQTSRRSNLYESYIDYNPGTDYGIDLNYKLYYYFRYFEETNHIRLIN